MAESAVADVAAPKTGVADNGAAEATIPDDLKSRAEWAKITRAQQTLARREKELQEQAARYADIDPEALTLLRENRELAQALAKGDRDALRRYIEPDNEVEKELARLAADDDPVSKVLNPLHRSMQALQQKLAEQDATIARLRAAEERRVVKEVERQISEVEKEFADRGIKDVFNRQQVLEALSQLPADIDLDDDTVKRVSDALYLDQILNAERQRQVAEKKTAEAKDAATPKARSADAAEAAAADAYKGDENERIFRALRKKGYDV